MSGLKIVISQHNFVVGNLKCNTEIIKNSIKSADKKGADIVLFPELALTGYPTEDLLYRKDFLDDVEKYKQKILTATKTKNIHAVISYPDKQDEKLYNAAALIHKGKIIRKYYKQLLPNYSVFDEKRYFTPGDQACLFELNGVKIAITICEDIWFPSGPVKQAKELGADLILSLNASPFKANKAEIRRDVIRDRALENNINIIYAHNVGAQDELVFDGGSIATNRHGEVCVHGNFFKEEDIEVNLTLNKETQELDIEKQPLPRTMGETELIYNAITLGVREYTKMSRVKGAIIGLSGGIDSAVTLALAVNALGAENVEAVIMPSRYTSSISIEDAIYQAEKLGINYHNLPIEEVNQSFLNTLMPVFSENNAGNNTKGNLQARCRAVLLMAIANEKDKIVLTTGNKSEMAVGYATLYGDMVGGFAPIKDVTKTMVYRLAKYINTLSAEPIIPKRVIEREPSAELFHNQLDRDDLPPYDVLDSIINRYLILDQGVEEIIQAGYERKTVAKVINMIEKNEYKRRQAAPGVRISDKAFGRDRRYPIVSGYIVSEVNNTEEK